MFTDSHSHLDDPQFDPDRNAVLERAAEAGVTRILTIGCLHSGGFCEAKIFEILDTFPGLVSAFGVHPHDARYFKKESLEKLGRLMQREKVVALGEIGLDFYYNHSPRPEQIEAFRRQVSLALEFGKPIIIHTRDAIDETLEVLSDYYSAGSEDNGVFHCFGGDQAIMERCLELGFSIGLGGTLTFKKAEALREAVKGCPRDRILIETDCPYLAPVPLRGKRNEPAYVTHVVRRLAHLLDLSVEETAQLTTENCSRLFRLDQTAS